MKPLAVGDDDLSRCISCGLCLPHCPTWRATGEERASPRGRIAAMRAVQFEGAPVDDAFASMMDECVQCRGCEPPCPAFVPFGHLMEEARAALRRVPARRGPGRRIAEWVAYRVVLPRHWLLVALTWVAWLLQRLRLLPRSGRFALPAVSARSLRRLEAGGAEGGEPVLLFTGCVMDAWMRDTHRAAVRVVAAAGGQVRLPGRGADCCGALHIHAGRADEARALAGRVVAALAGDEPVLVDSAGCGAMLKDYGRLLGTPEAEAFSTRVVDVHEWLEGRPLPVSSTGEPVVVQDPCHLRHVQRAHLPVHRVLSAAYEVRPTADDGLCCGAGGAYSLLQPRLAGALRDRKVAAIEAAGSHGSVVASANPGCILHLRAAGLDVRHPVELLDAALDGGDGGEGRE